MDMDNIIQDINMVITIFTREMRMPTILDMDTMVFTGKKNIYKCIGVNTSLVTIITVPTTTVDFMDIGSFKLDMYMVDIPTIDTTTDSFNERI